MNEQRDLDFEQERRIHPVDRRQGSLRQCDCTLQIRVNELYQAFPDGPHKHREAHESWMEAKKAEKEFYDNMKKAVMEKGITGFFTLIIIIIGLAITGLLAKLGLPFTK